MEGLIYRTLEAVRTAVSVAAGTSFEVALYEGIFDDEALNRVLTRSGTVHLTFIEANSAYDRIGGELILNLAFGAYVATSGRDRVLTALNTIEAVVASLIGIERQDPRPMPPYTMPIAIGEMQNLYSKGVEAKGVALYGLSFMVPVVLGEAVFAADQKNYDPSAFTFQIQEGEAAPVALDPNDAERLEPAGG